MFARVASRSVAAVASLGRRSAVPRISAVAALSTVSQAGARNGASRVAGAALAAAGGAIIAYSASSSVIDAAEKPYWGVPGTTAERTFIAVKPDGVQRGLVNEVIRRFEQKGYKLVAMKMMTPSKEFAEKHYADLSGRPFFRGLVSYFSSGPVVAMVWEGTDVILTGRKILGATNPNQAQPGTLRGDNCISTGRNLVHGSDGPKSAEDEIKLWFRAEEVQDYSRALDSWIVSDN